MSDHFDIIIVGTGADGGTLAYKLAPTGKRILLLERGDFLPREKENWSPVAVWGDRRYRNAGAPNMTTAADRVMTKPGRPPSISQTGREAWLRPTEVSRP